MTLLSFTLYHSKNIFNDSYYELTIDDDFEEGQKKAIQVGPKEEDSVLVVKYLKFEKFLFQKIISYPSIRENITAFPTVAVTLASHWQREC